MLAQGCAGQLLGGGRHSAQQAPIAGFTRRLSQPHRHGPGFAADQGRLVLLHRNPNRCGFASEDVAEQGTTGHEGTLHVGLPRHHQAPRDAGTQHQQALQFLDTAQLGTQAPHLLLDIAGFDRVAQHGLVEIHVEGLELAAQFDCIGHQPAVRQTRQDLPGHDLLAMAGVQMFDEAVGAGAQLCLFGHPHHAAAHRGEGQGHQAEQGHGAQAQRRGPSQGTLADRRRQGHGKQAAPEAINGAQHEDEGQAGAGDEPQGHRPAADPGHDGDGQSQTVDG